MSNEQSYRSLEVEFEARPRARMRSRISRRRGGKVSRRSNSPKAKSGLHRRRVKKMSW